jgi:hypothetical protein
MKKRAKNPVHTTGRKFRFAVKQGVKVPVKGAELNKRERREFSKTVDYIDRVKLMRPYFGDTFKPDKGFNLHDVESWSPAQKTKVTRYFRIMAPRIAGGEKQVKRYRRKDHLLSAIDASLQEERLPGQTAAVFSVDPGQRVEITFDKKHKPIVKRGGITEQEFRFDKNSLMRNWKDEVTSKLAQTDARLFKVIMGANRSEKTFNRDQLMDEIIQLMESYPVRRYGKRRYDDRRFDEWLNGFVAYKGVTMRQMKADIPKHKEIVRQRRLARERERARKIRIWKHANPRGKK